MVSFNLKLNETDLEVEVWLLFLFLFESELTMFEPSCLTGVENKHTNKEVCTNLVYGYKQ